MLNRLAGIEIARAHIARNWEPLPPPDSWALVEESTVERPWGWVFVFTSQKWLETGDFTHAVAGNAPLLVERSTSTVIPLGTANPIAYYVDEYEKKGRERHDG